MEGLHISALSAKPVWQDFHPTAVLPAALLWRLIVFLLLHKEIGCIERTLLPNVP